MKTGEVRSLGPRTRRGNTPRRGPLTQWTYCSPLAAAIGKEFAKVRIQIRPNSDFTSAELYDVL